MKALVLVLPFIILGALVVTLVVLPPFLVVGLIVDAFKTNN